MRIEDISTAKDVQDGETSEEAVQEMTEPVRWYSSRERRPLQCIQINALIKSRNEDEPVQVTH